MEKELKEKIDSYRSLNKKIAHFEEATRILNWDVKTGAPKDGLNQRADVIATLSKEAYKIATSDEMGKLLYALTKPENFKELDFISMRSIEVDKKRYLEQKQIPLAKYESYIKTVSKAHNAWKTAKVNNDFQIFKPYLEKIVQFNKEKSLLLNKEGHPYNALLNEYEPGMTVEKLDLIFNQVKLPLIELLKKVQIDADPSILNRALDVSKQKEFVLNILNNMGFKKSRGRLDATMHPFAVKINDGDVRITLNKFHPNRFKSNLYAGLHEGGHALYEQNLGEHLIHTSLHAGTSHGIHEAQSRFWENIIGKSFEFMFYLKNELDESFPGHFNDVSPIDLYRSVNMLKDTTIRTHADEISYNLHIILRYELEKDLISGKISVADLPQKWNEKTYEFFGVYPQDDGSGVLQDVHWALGYIGYFPTYALGNIYSAQLMATIEKEIPNIKLLIRNGEFATLTDWFSSNVYPFGKLLLPEELMKAVTGEEISPQLYINYIENKYSVF